MNSIIRYRFATEDDKTFQISIPLDESNVNAPDVLFNASSNNIISAQPFDNVELKSLTSATIYNIVKTVFDYREKSE